MTTQALVTLSAADLRPDDTGEPRILDTDLAARLGFDRPRNIRLLIGRRRDELEDYGSIVEVDLDRYGTPQARPGTAPQALHGEAPDTPKKGRKSGRSFRYGAENSGPEIMPEDATDGITGRGFLLTKNQALTVAIMSEAPGAAAVRRMLIDAFNAYRAGPVPLPKAAKLPPLMIGMTPAVTVKVEIHDRAGLHNVQGRDFESPATKAKLRKATVEVFLEMYTVRSSGMSIPRKELEASWQECRTENDLPRMLPPDLFRLVAEAGFEVDRESVHGLRYKMIPGVTPQLTQRRGHTGEPARLAALEAPSRPALPALTHRRGDA